MSANILVSVKESPVDYLKKFFGFNNFKGDQENVITDLLEGNDVFVIMPTGGGKSLVRDTFGVMLGGVCLTITPLLWAPTRL